MSITVQLPTPHHRSRAEVRAQNCWPPRPARCLLSSKDILRTAVQNRTPASTLTLAPSILLLSGLDAGLWHWSSRLQNQFPRLSPGPRSAGLDVDRVKVLDVGLSTGPEVYSTGSRSAVLDVGLQHSMSGPQGQTSGPGTGSRVRRPGRGSEAQVRIPVRCVHSFNKRELCARWARPPWVGGSDCWTRARVTRGSPLPCVTASAPGPGGSQRSAEAQPDGAARSRRAQTGPRRNPARMRALLRRPQGPLRFAGSERPGLPVGPWSFRFRVSG